MTPSAILAFSVSTALVEAFARLTSLRQNLPEHEVAVKYVNEYHEILDLLEQASGGNLVNSRIPASEVRPIVVASNYLDGSVTYSDDSFCDHAFFTMKVDAVLMMFEMAMGSRPSPIGFKPPGTGEDWSR